LLRPEKFVLNNSKTKNLAPSKMHCAPPNIETWLLACAITLDFLLAEMMTFSPEQIADFPAV